MAISGLEQGPGGVPQTLHLVELLVLVLDVDGHVRVDLLESAEELGPPRGVMAAADRDEVPGRALRPAAQGVAAAQRHRAGVVRRDAAEPVVEHAVEPHRVVDPHVLGRRVVDQPAEGADGGDRVDLLHIR